MRLDSPQTLIPRLILAALAVASMAGLQPAEATVIEAFTADRDTTLLAGIPDSNFGDYNHLPIGDLGGATDQRSILSFDVGDVPSGATINGITLNLYVAANELNESMTIALHAITADNRDWVEGDGGTNGAGDPGWSTWNERIKGSANWAGDAGLAEPGDDYAITALSTVVVGNPSVTPLGSWVEFSFSGTSDALTDLIDSWREDNVEQMRANPGLLLFKTTELSGTVHERLVFASREWNVALQRPELVVEYTLASTAVPEPSTVALLGLGLIAMLGLAWKRRRG